MTRLAVPLLDLQAQYRPLRDELLAAVTRVCDSQRFIMGPEVDALERDLEAAIGVSHAITMSSGTSVPASMYSFTFLPMGVPASTAARNMSPVEICGMWCFSIRNWA